MRLCSWSVVISISRFGLLNSDPESWLEDIEAHLLLKIHRGGMNRTYGTYRSYKSHKSYSCRHQILIAGSGNIIESQTIFYELQISTRRKTSALCFCRHQSPENGSAPSRRGHHRSGHGQP